MANWNNLSPFAVSSDYAYSSGILEMLHARGAHASENFGNARVFHFKGGYDGLLDYASRPFVSVSGLSCIAAIPWWIPEGLTRIKSEFWVRVSNYEIDKNLGEIDPSENLPIELNVRFLKNFAVAGVEVYPELSAGVGASWIRVELDYDLGEWAGDLRHGFWDYLVLEFRSAIVSTLAGNDIAGTLSSAAMTNRRAFRVIASSQYADPGPPAPGIGAPETLCTILSENRVTTPYRIGGVVDHVMRVSDNEMVIWPPNVQLLEQQASSAWISIASYLQIASWSVQEVFEDTSGGVDSDRQSHRPAYARVQSSTGAAINRTLQRKEIASGLSEGWAATSVGGAGWTDRDYFKRWIATYGTLGSARDMVETVCTISQPTRGITVKAQLAGVYATRDYYQEETYKETFDKSVSGYVTVRTTIIQQGVVFGAESTIKSITFVITNKLSTSKFLYCAAWLNNGGASEPETLVYQEGTLRLEGPRQAIAAQRVGGRLALDDDSAVLTDPSANYEVEILPATGFDWRLPFEVTVEVEITDGPDGAQPSFKSETASATLPRGPAGVPFKQVMQVFVVAQSVWSTPSPDVVASEGIVPRDSILASQLRQTLDAQSRSRHAWGTELCFRPKVYSVSSVSPTQANNVGDEDLSVFDAVFRPVKPDVDAMALASPESSHVVELRAEVTGTAIVYAYLYEIDSTGTSTVPDITIVADVFDGSLVLGREIVTLKTSPPSDILGYRVRFFASGTGNVTAITLAEVHPTDAHEGRILASGDLYVAKAVHAAAITSWRGFDSVQLTGTGVMVRDEFGTLRHAVAFNGSSHSFQAPVTTSGDVAYSIAVNSDVASASPQVAMGHVVGGNAVCVVFYLSGVLYLQTRHGGVDNVVSLGAASVETWYDVVVLCEGARRAAWVNGKLVLDDAPGALDVGAGDVYVGNSTWDGKLALPAVVHDFDFLAASRYVLRRRQVLGTY